MINIQITDGARNGMIIFHGDEAFEPCNFDVIGDFTSNDISSLFWLVTMTGEGTAQGIYPLDGQMCAPYELLRVLALTSVTVSDVPQDWTEEMEADAYGNEEQFTEGGVS